jgi:hypothetical protein
MTLLWTEMWEFDDERIEVRAFSDGRFVLAYATDGEVIDTFRTYDDAQYWLENDEFRIVWRHAPDGSDLAMPAP